MAINLHSVTDSDRDGQLLQKAVENSKWSEVRWCLLTYLYPPSLCRWAIEKVAEYGSFDYVREILEKYAEVDIMLPHLVRRRQWLAVKFALDYCVNAEQKTWVVVEASEYCCDEDFVQYISKHLCLADCRCVLERLVARGMWHSVYIALQMDISETEHRWVMTEAGQLSDDDSFHQYMLPACTEEELEEVVPHLITRGLWKSAGSVFKNTKNPTLHHYIFQQVLQHADNDAFVNYVMTGCLPEETEQALRHLVNWSLWGQISFLLARVSEKQRQWAIEQASQTAGERDFVENVLYHCSDQDLELVVTNMAARGVWDPVDSTALSKDSLYLHISTQLMAWHRWPALRAFLRREFDVTHKVRVAEQCVREGVDLYDVLPPRYVEALPMAVEHRQWKWTSTLVNCIIFYTLRHWLTNKDEDTTLETLLWKLIQNCRLPVCKALELSKATLRSPAGKMSITEYYQDIEHDTSLSEHLAELFMTSVQKTVCNAVCSNDSHYLSTSPHQHQHISDIYTDIICCLNENRNCLCDKAQPHLQNQETWTLVFTQTANRYRDDPLFLLHFLQALHVLYTSRKGQTDDTPLLAMFTVLPLFPQLQSNALRMMLRKKRWGVISQACLSHVWEHDRRQLFKAAVDQRQWSVVRQWADHTVHDDQRYWAMEEAFREKQWGVYLVLADFGLTMREQMHAHYMIAKYADWDTVLALMERGGDVAEVNWLLYNFAEARLRKTPRGDASVYQQRCQKLLEVEDYLAKHSYKDCIKALKRSRWRVVMFCLLNDPGDDYFAAVKDKAIEDQAWHVLMHVVRLGLNRAERDGLFPDMVRRQQWEVCRMLLEYGVDVSLCIEALPELMERNQWMLVARVMEYSVDDAVRCQVMQCAFQRRAGALFWHCLTIMENEEQLSMEIRVTLFHQAISRDIWQAVKPLVEEKDDQGIQCRDMAFLEAIEQHLWDVVDHCQVLGADINMKDENGETPLHREARKEEWKAIEEIVFRDGDPNLLDKDGVSVLNRLIESKQWRGVQFVIKYGTNIHLVAKTARSMVEIKQELCSPLQLLISAGRMDIIDFTLMWCPEQGKGVNQRGQTTLHVACASERWDLLPILVARKADPLALTTDGQSALIYAVCNPRCPEQMVAQCVRLGFSSHQPSLTRFQERIVDNFIYDISPFYRWKYGYAISSPFLLALIRARLPLARMLYESGACSRTELMALHAQLPHIADSSTEDGRKLHDAYYNDMIRSEKSKTMDLHYSLQQRLLHSLPLLTQLLGTVRSLKSSCRLVISRCLDVRGKRPKDIQRLRLTPELTDYLLFSDLTDPNYGQH
ncbi:hypothetical protein ACOMHN_063696 [Nucella lapillus]